MVRLMVIALVLSGFGLLASGCTNTVRGLGQDLNNNAMQNYNSRTASNLD
jgi:predicted small secreted protein